MKITDTGNAISIKSDVDKGVINADDTGYSISFIELARILKEIDTRLKILEK